jgi:purine-binding chemotaxis protein CheW
MNFLKRLMLDTQDENQQKGINKTMPKSEVPRAKASKKVNKNKNTTKTTVSNEKSKSVIAKVAKEESPSNEKVVEMVQVVTFELDNEEYASPITDLKEIIRIPEIVSVPGSHLFIRGVFNLRGQVVVVIDLEKRFDLRRSKPVKARHLIILEVKKSVFGIIVDEVSGVLRVPVTRIKSVPTAIKAKINAEYIKGVIILDEELQNTEKVISRPSSGQAKEIENEGLTTQNKSKAGMFLMLDLPKMLTDQELLGFGEEVHNVVENILEK